MPTSRPFRRIQFSALAGAGLAALVWLVPACATPEVIELHDGGVSDPFPEADPARNCPQLACSSDLRSILDRCTDSVLEVCPNDQACGIVSVACKDPCEVAVEAQTSLGCEFYAVPPEEPTHHGGCFAATITNGWGSPVDVMAELGGEVLDLSLSIYRVVGEGPTLHHEPLLGPIAPGETAVVFLAGTTSETAVACPEGVKPVVTEDAFTSGTSRTRAFRLLTNRPVTASSVFPYGGAKAQVPTATLLLPTSLWYSEYIAVTPDRVDTPDHEPVPDEGTVTQVGRRTLQLVAMEDETEIRMRPVVDLVEAEGVAGVAKGQVQTWMLNKGEVLQFAQDESLFGSPIQSSRRIGLFGGAESSFVPSTWRDADVMQQQILPVREWDSWHALVPHRPRVDDSTPFPTKRERVPWTIVAATDDTELSFDPAPPPGVRTKLNVGERVTFFTDDVLSVRSQNDNHPIFVASYMTGANFDGGASAPWARGGDPDFVPSLAVDQFQTRHVFETDANFANTSVTIVRRKTDKGFADVWLECASETPVTDFRPVGTSGELEYAWVELTVGFQSVYGTCAYGAHRAQSDGPFSLTVWGTDDHASYGYPATMAGPIVYPIGGE